MHFVILVLMWTIIGQSWNILSGYCGQVSFGHAAFFGLGAYTAGILYTKLGISAWWGIVASIPIIAIFAIFLGYIVLRLRGPFLLWQPLQQGRYSG